MDMINTMAAAGMIEPGTTEKAAEIVFEPANFVTSLQYMGVGMLVIFAVIGLIALTTVLINKIFSE